MRRVHTQLLLAVSDGKRQKIDVNVALVTATFYVQSLFTDHFHGVIKYIQFFQ